MLNPELSRQWVAIKQNELWAEAAQARPAHHSQIKRTSPHPLHLVMRWAVVQLASGKAILRATWVLHHAADDKREATWN